MYGTLACKIDALVSSLYIWVDADDKNWLMPAIESGLHEKDSEVASKSQGNDLSTKSGQCHEQESKGMGKEKGRR